MSKFEGPLGFNAKLQPQTTCLEVLCGFDPDRDPRNGSQLRHMQAALGAATSILDNPDGTSAVLAKRETQRHLN